MRMVSKNNFLKLLKLMRENNDRIEKSLGCLKVEFFEPEFALQSQFLEMIFPNGFEDIILDYMNSGEITIIDGDKEKVIDNDEKLWEFYVEY